MPKLDQMHVDITAPHNGELMNYGQLCYMQAELNDLDIFLWRDCTSIEDYTDYCKTFSLHGCYTVLATMHDTLDAIHDSIRIMQDIVGAARYTSAVLKTL